MTNSKYTKPLKVLAFVALFTIALGSSGLWAIRECESQDTKMSEKLQALEQNLTTLSHRVDTLASAWQRLGCTEVVKYPHEALTQGRAND